MISVQEKLNVFRQYLLRKTKEDEKQVLDASKEKATEEIHASDLKLAEEKKAIEERYGRLEVRDTNKIIAEGNTYAKNAKLNVQRKIEAEFEECVRKTAAGYLSSDLYKEYLKKCVKDLANDVKQPQLLHVYISDSDKALFEADAAPVLKGFRFDYMPLPAQAIGGFTVRDQNERVSLDYSLGNLITENKKLIGVELHEAMEEA